MEPKKIKDLNYYTELEYLQMKITKLKSKVGNYPFAMKNYYLNSLKLEEITTKKDDIKDIFIKFREDKFKEGLFLRLF